MRQFKTFNHNIQHAFSRRVLSRMQDFETLPSPPQDAIRFLEERGNIGGYIHYSRTETTLMQYGNDPLFRNLNSDACRFCCNHTRYWELVLTAKIWLKENQRHTFSGAVWSGHYKLASQIKLSSHRTQLSGDSVVKNHPANARDTGSTPGSGRSPGEGNGNTLQYSCLGNPMDRGAWWSTAHGVSKELDTT